MLSYNRSLTFFTLVFVTRFPQSVSPSLTHLPQIFLRRHIGPWYPFGPFFRVQSYFLAFEQLA